MSDLPKFLLERIAEDERVAQAARINEHPTERDAIPLRWSRDEAGYARVIATSGRVLAECEAKRRIVETALEYGDPDDTYDTGNWAFYVSLRALALPYADHPDFREEWKP